MEEDAGQAGDGQYHGSTNRADYYGACGGIVVTAAADFAAARLSAFFVAAPFAATGSFGSRRHGHYLGADGAAVCRGDGREGCQGCKPPCLIALGRYVDPRRGPACVGAAEGLKVSRGAKEARVAKG